MLIHADVKFTKKGGILGIGKTEKTQRIYTQIMYEKVP
jgi:hypothetical protein